MKLKALAAGVVFSLAAGSALAATNPTAPTVGTSPISSSGSLLVSLTVPSIVMISGLTDIALGTFAGVDMSGTSPACVYRNVTGKYRITATGTNSATNYVLKETGGNTIPYAVTWNGTALADNTALTGQTGASTTSTTCGGTPNSTIGVSVLATDIQAAAALGAYSDTLTLTLTSE